MLHDTLMGLLYMGALALAIFLLAWGLGLIRFVKVSEGFYTAFKEKGRFIYGAMEFAEHYIDPGGNIHLSSDASVPAADRKNEHGVRKWIWRWGGWILYLWPFVEPAKYEDYNDPADGFGHEIYVRLGDVASNPFVTEAETTEDADPGEESGSIGVNVKFTSKMRVHNPRKFLFVSPKNVIKEAIEDRQAGVLRAWVNNGDRRHVQSAKGNGAQLWTELETANLVASFDEARDDWGLEIVPKSIIVKEVGFDPSYQAAMEAKSKQKLVARGEKARIFDPITGAMEDWARSRMPGYPGLDYDEVVAKLQKKPKGGGSSLWDLKEKEIEETRRAALAGQNYRKSDYTTGGQPMDGNLAQTIAVAEAFGGAMVRNRGQYRRQNQGQQGQGGQAGQGGQGGGGQTPPPQNPPSRRPPPTGQGTP